MVVTTQLLPHSGNKETYPFRFSRMHPGKLDGGMPIG
jgi:hypothetical protein